MKIMTVVGARPQFIKASTVLRAFGGYDDSALEHVLVHTGQHYDEAMSGAFFRELEISSPDFNLDAGGGSHAQQLAQMLQGLELLIPEIEPNVVLTYGDTNSTLAAALTSAQAGVPLAHVEAGLRSFRRGMAEEVNRVVTDRLSQFLFCPTRASLEQLGREGLAAGAIFVGDVMLDSFRFWQGKIDFSSRRKTFGVKEGSPYVLATIHRAENTDDPRRFGDLINGLKLVAAECPVIFPIHPRTSKALETGRFFPPPENIRLLDPVGYVDMLSLVAGAEAVLTDSGGLQKEAFFAGVPCVTLREETEWTETLAGGRNILSGSSPDEVRTVALSAMARGRFSEVPDQFGSGDAAQLICRVLLGNDA